jgi:hypothetical protein
MVRYKTGASFGVLPKHSAHSQLVVLGKSSQTPKRNNPDGRETSSLD